MFTCSQLHIKHIKTLLHSSTNGQKLHRVPFKKNNLFLHEIHVLLSNLTLQQQSIKLLHNVQKHLDFKTLSWKSHNQHIRLFSNHCAPTEVLKLYAVSWKLRDSRCQKGTHTGTQKHMLVKETCTLKLNAQEIGQFLYKRGREGQRSLRKKTRVREWLTEKRCVLCNF